MSFIAKLIWSIIIALLLYGCTVIKIDGSSKISSIRFGVLSIQPDPNSRVTVYQSMGFGLVPGRSGPTLGFLDEKAALVYNGEDCRIIIFKLPSDKAAQSKLFEIMKNSTDVCTLKGGKDEKIDPSLNGDGQRTGSVRIP